MQVTPSVMSAIMSVPGNNSVVFGDVYRVAKYLGSRTFRREEPVPPPADLLAPPPPLRQMPYARSSFTNDDRATTVPGDDVRSVPGDDSDNEDWDCDVITPYN